MKTNSKKIVLIGSGNVATHLGKVLRAKGNKIIQVYSKTLSSAKTLAHTLKSTHTNKISELDKTADIYIIAIKDDAIEIIAKQLYLGNKFVIHTSGSIEMSVLKKMSSNIGVFYPLQTFSKNADIDLSNTPIFIEANNLFTENTLIKLAKEISAKVHIADSKQRQTIHLAAVFASNFSNHMYALAAQLLKKQNIPFEILIPLIDETAAKIHKRSPAESQTGPAIRRDEKIIKKHLKLLQNNNDLEKVYSLLTKSIKKQIIN